MVKLGLFDFAHGVAIYIAEDAAVEGVDIAGVAENFDQARKTVDAYAPILSAAFEKKYGAHVMNYYPWPSQMFYCNSPIKGLADIKGKKVHRLDAKTKAFMEATFKDHTDKWWQTIIDEDTMGLNCTTGTGQCSVGKPGKLVKVEPSAADNAALETAMRDVVLKRWAKRCGADASCIKNWNDTVGKVVNLTAAP